MKQAIDAVSRVLWSHRVSGSKLQRDQIAEDILLNLKARGWFDPAFVEKEEDHEPFLNSLIE